MTGDDTQAGSGVAPDAAPATTTTSTDPPVPASAPTSNATSASILLLPFVGPGSAGRADALRVSCEKLKKRLNGLQTYFNIDVLPVVSTDDDFDERRAYSDAFLIQKLADVTRAYAAHAGVVAVTMEPIDEDSFDRHLADQLGIVTFFDWRKYVHPGCREAQYLAYLVLCESIQCIARKDLEHKQVHYCLFDLCRDKNDLRLCLRLPSYEHHCKHVVAALGTLAEDSAKRILAFVGSKNLITLGYYALREPANSFLLGVVLALAGSAAATFYPRACLSIAGAILGSVLALFVVMQLGYPRLAVWYRKKRKKWKAAIVAIALALPALMGAVGAFTAIWGNTPEHPDSGTHIPPKPSTSVPTSVGTVLPPTTTG